MSLARLLVDFRSAHAEPSLWEEAAREEAPVGGHARACSGCPLRVDGPWEAGARATLPAASPETRERLQEWGCHETGRPCAGMRRMLRATKARALALAAALLLPGCTISGGESCADTGCPAGQRCEGARCVPAVPAPPICPPVGLPFTMGREP